MKFNYSLDDMRYFCAVARYGSFKQASVVLKMPLSTLSRRIARLEENLQLRLLNRDAHRVQLTHSGKCYYERSSHLFDELDDVALSIHKDKIDAKGWIRISAPVNFGTQVLAQYFNDFLIQYPDIHLDLRLSNKTIDIDEETIDLAFRIGKHTANHWVGRHLKNIHFVICSAVNLDVSEIKEPGDLSSFPNVICDPMLTWKLKNDLTGEMLEYKPTGNIRLKVDDFVLLTRAIQDGLGIGFVPDYHVQTLIETGELKRVLPDWSNQPRSCQMLYRDRQNIPYRVRLLIDFMRERFKKTAH